MIRKTVWVYGLLFVLLLAGCGSKEPVTLTVFAAASLTDAFTEAGQTFTEANPEVNVTFSFAGSQELATQINEEAPADVFASANHKQMDAAIVSGRINRTAPQIFVQNRLVVVVPDDNLGGINTLEDLAKEGVQLVFAAAEVPVGQYTVDFLTKATESGEFAAGYQEAVLANVVSYEQNVRAVLTKISLGEGDAGVVYASDVVGTEAENVLVLEIPDDLNTIAQYPIAPLNDSEQGDAAAAFINFILSTEGQAILAQYGFIPAK
jgi:molybdate transport system substrate-binding protein